ncbi:hypothetical protein [Kluyvera sichuanensis]
MLITELDANFIERLKNISIDSESELNFFELGGSGYLENPT